MDGSPFVDQRRPVSRTGLDLQHAPRHQVITPPMLVDPAGSAPPGIEAPIHSSPGAPLIHYEGRAHIAHPGIIAGDHGQPDPRQQHLAGPSYAARRNANGQRLAIGNCGRNQRESLLGRQCPFTPVIRPLGPQHPAAGMPLEFRGHPEAIAYRDRGERLIHGVILTKDLSSDRSVALLC